MHELSLCRGIADIVERARAGRPVEAVGLRVGRLRQVVPGTLVHCWDVVTADGPLDGARLEVEHVPVRLQCRDCGATTEVAHVLVLTCAVCGGGHVEVLTGEELLVTTLRLRPVRAVVPAVHAAPPGHEED